MEWPQARKNGKTDKNQRKSPHLEVARKRILREIDQAHRLRAGGHERGDHSDKHHGAAGEGVEGELHRAILAPRRSPDGNQKILGDDRDLIEDEQQKEIEAQKNAIHRPDEHQVKLEKLRRAPLDIPGEQNTGDGGDSGQQQKHQADAVDREVILNAQ